MVEADIRRLCNKFSDLQPDDIEEIVKEALTIEKSMLYQEEDVFIDVLSDVTDEAIVVYHRQPKLKDSIYQETVVGKVAKRLNEPGVYRTFETSLKTEGLLAKTQENRLIRQKVFPIRNKQRNIGVLIIESLATKESEVDFYMVDEKIISEPPKMVMGLKEIIQTDSFYHSLFNKLDEALLMFDRDGFLVVNNDVAESYYYHFGYMEEIKGFHYDNLSLDTSTFEQLWYLKEAGKWDSVAEKEIIFGESHFKMTRFFSEDGNVFSMILHDKTEIYNKEVEIISKSVAIKEIHHRVKNNLQSVVSLLRIQSRRSESAEVKKLLRESETRILAISTAHELLSKQLVDDISLASVLNLTINNVHRSFLGSKQISLEKHIDDQICLDSDKTVTIALIVNELLQNSFEHGFMTEHPDNLIQIEVTEADYQTISIVVQDNGVGYNPKKTVKSSLGLQIVNSYVKEKLRGKLHTKSTKHGTTTRFYFKK